MTPARIALFVLMLVLAGSFFILDLGQYLNLAYLKARQADIEFYYVNNPVRTMLMYFCIYVCFTSLSLPAASILTLAGGAIFGVISGTVLVSFASTLGATLAFLASRYLFRDLVLQKFADKLTVINRGMEKDGAYYLFTLRLVPIFPFFIINLLMGLTNIRSLTFAFVSQLGMLAGTIVYVNAGTQLARIEEPGDILSPGLLASFVLLGIFPLAAKKSVDLFRARRARRRNSQGNEGSV